MPSMRDHLLKIVWKVKKTIIVYLFTQKYAGYQKFHVNSFYALFDSVLEFMESKDKDLRHKNV